MPTRMLAVVIVLALSSAAAAQDPADAPRELVVYPAQVKLAGPRDEQRLVVVGTWADGRKLDLTRTASVSTGSAAIAVVERGVVRPVADGTTTLTIEANGAKATVPVTVESAAADEPVSFAREVQPILTKAGCNSGACHGASARPRRLPAVALRLRLRHSITGRSCRATRAGASW